MMQQLPSLNHLLRQLQQVPYLASKNLYRVADHFLIMDRARIEQFCASLIQAHEALIRCNRCFAWQEKEGNCLFCDQPKRNQSIICVVETWHDLCAIEKSSSFHGVYHILGGSLCPLDGVGPDQLTIKQLIARLTTFSGELFLALSQNPEGEATAAYIVKQLSVPSTITVSCISRGVPIGATLESIDRVTMGKAIVERRPY